MSQITATDRFWLRGARRFVMLLLAMLTLAIMWAILVPVHRGVSDDSRQRDLAGLPIDRFPPGKPRR